MNELPQIINFICNASPYAVLVVIILILFFNPEKVMIWKSEIYALGSKTSTRLSKKAIQNKVRGTIIKLTKEISKENKYILPYDMKVEWVQNESKKTLLENNQIIIRMGLGDNKSRNVVTALSEYINKGFMPKTRRYVDENIVKASDLNLMRKMLILGYQDGLDIFDDEVYLPLIEADKQIKDMIQNIISIDDDGMFIPILINEFIKASRILHPDIPNQTFKNETKEFLNFLYRHATTPKDQLREFEFKREYIKVVVALMSSDYTLYEKGENFYIRKISKAINNGFDTIYLLSLGSKIVITEDICSRIKETEPRIKSINNNKYIKKSKDGHKQNGSVIEITVRTDQENF